MEEITAKLVEKGIITKEWQEEENGDTYIAYKINSGYTLIYDSIDVVNQYEEKYVNGKLYSISLYDEYDMSSIYNKNDFIKYVEVFKNENIFKEI